MHEFLKRYPIISDQVDKDELSVILRELEKVLIREVHGDLAEFGCYVGTTALFLQRLLAAKDSDKVLHAYDSFAGLPQKTQADYSPAGEQYKQGELHATKADLIKHFRQAGVRLPLIHKGWFSDLLPTDLPPSIAFAFLDGDFYESILVSLKLVWPRLSTGATIIVDDYATVALPGARRAVDEWLKEHPATLRSEASLAIIYPL